MPRFAANLSMMFNGCRSSTGSMQQRRRASRRWSICFLTSIRGKRLRIA